MHLSIILYLQVKSAFKRNRMIKLHAQLFSGGHFKTLYINSFQGPDMTRFSGTPSKFTFIVIFL